MFLKGPNFPAVPPDRSKSSQCRSGAWEPADKNTAQNPSEDCVVVECPLFLCWFSQGYLHKQLKKNPRSLLCFQVIGCLLATQTKREKALPSGSPSVGCGISPVAADVAGGISHLPLPQVFKGPHRSHKMVDAARVQSRGSNPRKSMAWECAVTPQFENRGKEE